MLVLSSDSREPKQLEMQKKRLPTLSEAGIEGPGTIRIQAVSDWLHAQVDHLVEAELPAVDGGSFRFKGNEELLRTVR